MDDRDARLTPSGCQTEIGIPIHPTCSGERSRAVRARELLTSGVGDEDARVSQFELRSREPSPTILFYELTARKFGLRIFVKCSRIRIGRSSIQVIIVFLNVFSMVSFRAGETKKAFLQDRIVSVPECERKTKPALAVSESE
jgi:hypothetical protein